MPDSKAKRDWMKQNTTFVGLKLNNNTDAEIIAKLKEQPSMQGYIKRLIEEDIKRG